MARKLNDPNNQEGSGLNQALLDAEQQRQMQEQEQRQSAQPQLATRSRVSQAGQQASPTIKSMPQQQPAGTGTFTNLRKYLEAAKPSQQRIAQVATQRVEGLAGAAQKGIQQAKESFGRNIEAGSLANMGEALGQAQNIIGAARGVTYQPQQVTPPTTPPTEYFFNGHMGPELNEAGIAKLGDKAAAFQEELNQINSRVHPMDYGPGSSNSRSMERQDKDRQALYEKYGLISQASTTPPTQQYISPEDQARFAEIINAAYQGPASLQEAGLYSGAAEKARRAQQTIGDVQTATGRERLLRDVFGRTRDYTAGQSLLDQLLLNTSGEGVRSVQEAAQRAGNLEQVMQQAVRETAAQAGQRREAIADIRGQAREALTGARTEEEKAVEKRIDDLIITPAVDEQGNKIAKLDSKGKPVVDAEGNPVYLTEWERLPAYFQDIFRQRQTNKALALSAREMEILGLSSGQGLFNVGQGAIGGVAAERERLITKDELARQLALQQLAGLDVSRELQKDLRYTDLEKAGTQDLLSSLDVGKFERTLKEQQKKLQDLAKKTNIGANLSYNPYYASNFSGINENMVNLLKRAGLDINKMSPTQLNDFVNNASKQNAIDYIGRSKDTIDWIKKMSKTPEGKPYEKLIKEFNKKYQDWVKKSGLLNIARTSETDVKASTRSQVLKDILGEE